MLHQSCIISILITQKSKGLMKWNQKTHVEPISLHRCLGISLCPGDARRASLRAADVNFSGPPKSPLISSNYETRIAVYKDWYLILSYIYNIIIDIDHPKIQWNILKQLHSHLGGETYEDFHAPTPPPRNHQTTTHSEPKRNVTHRLSDMSCNMEWRSWCSSWRLAIQANKVMPTKSAKFMGTLKIPGGQKLPPPQGNSEHRKKGPHFEPPQKKALHLLDFRALHRRHSRECLVKRQKVYIYMTKWWPGMNRCAAWCCINVNMHQFFGHVLCAKNKSKTSYHFLAFTFQILFFANGNESPNSMQPWRQRVVNWS